MGSSDASYGCVFQKEDPEGNTGVYLSKELMSIAGHALKANITTLGPLVLPLSEQILFFLNLIGRKVCRILTRSWARRRVCSYSSTTSDHEYNRTP